MSDKYTFNRMVLDFIKHLTQEYKEQGKNFVLAKGDKLVDVTDAFHSGSLTPLLLWEMDNRRFEMFEGYRRTGPIDWFRHNSAINFIPDGSMFLGVRTTNFLEENLPMSKQDFLLHLADAMESLYNSTPSGSVYLDERKEDKLQRHLSEEEQKEQDKIAAVRVLNKMVDKFHAWRALYETFAIAVIADPNIVHENKLEFADHITYQLVKERLDRLKGINMPSELFGRGFEPYPKQLENFIKEKVAEKQMANTQANTQVNAQEIKQTQTIKSNLGRGF